MAYVDGLVFAVPNDRRAEFEAYSRKFLAVFKQLGATRLVDCWGDDVPDGKLTSFPMAVKCEAGETVVFSWIEWPSREVRNAAWETMQKDPAMQMADNPMPFDGKRMIYGGFEMITEA